MSGGDYMLIGADGRPWPSRVPGGLGGHRRSLIYGRLDCPSALAAIARGGYVDARVFFADEATARAAGYRPCGRCLPDAYRAWRTSAASTGARSIRRRGPTAGKLELVGDDTDGGALPAGARRVRAWHRTRTAAGRLAGPAVVRLARAQDGLAQRPSLVQRDHRTRGSDTIADADRRETRGHGHARG